MYKCTEISTVANIDVSVNSQTWFLPSSCQTVQLIVTVKENLIWDRMGSLNNSNWDQNC